MRPQPRLGSVLEQQGERLVLGQRCRGQGHSVRAGARDSVSKAGACSRGVGRSPPEL